MSKIISFRLSELEYELIEKVARESNKSVPEYFKSLSQSICGLEEIVKPTKNYLEEMINKMIDTKLASVLENLPKVEDVIYNDDIHVEEVVEVEENLDVHVDDDEDLPLKDHKFNLRQACETMGINYQTAISWLRRNQLDKLNKALFPDYIYEAKEGTNHWVKRLKV